MQEKSFQKEQAAQDDKSPVCGVMGFALSSLVSSSRLLARLQQRIAARNEPHRVAERLVICILVGCLLVKVGAAPLPRAQTHPLS
eukprot:2443017-Prymnesium_polylepis.1